VKLHVKKGDTVVVLAGKDKGKEGKIVEDTQALYFHMTRLDIKNALVGKAKLGDIFGDILITKLDALPLKTRIESVDHRAGAIVVRLAAGGNEE